jgi:hypothetical protein
MVASDVCVGPTEPVEEGAVESGKSVPEEPPCKDWAVLGLEPEVEDSFVVKEPLVDTCEGIDAGELPRLETFGWDDCASEDGVECDVVCETFPEVDL